jgi:hypothetical protein
MQLNTQTRLQNSSPWKESNIPIRKGEFVTKQNFVSNSRSNWQILWVTRGKTTDISVKVYQRGLLKGAANSAVCIGGPRPARPADNEVKLHKDSART